MKILTQTLPYIQLGLSVLLVICILIQRSEAGMGTIGGGSDSGVIHHTRRGFEKFIFYTTIILSILFAISAFLAVTF